MSFLDQTVSNAEGIGRTKELCASGEGRHECKLFLPKANNNSPEHLADEMQSVIDTKHGSLVKKLNASISITYVKSKHRLIVVAENPKQARVRFPALLGEALGVNPNMSEKPIGNEEYAFKYGVDLNILHNRLYVYSDVVDYTYLGEVMAPILRAIPFKNSKHSQQSHKEFFNVHFVPVATSFIQQVLISNKGDGGKDILFSSGKSLIKLHFRQRLDKYLTK